MPEEVEVLRPVVPEGEVAYSRTAAEGRAWAGGAVAVDAVKGDTWMHVRLGRGEAAWLTSAA